MTNMADGNTAALRSYMSEQDRLERQAPTDSELESYIEDWIETKIKKMGSQAISEAFVEADDYSGIYRAVVEDDALEIGLQFKKLIRKYWEKSAITASEEINFEEDRNPY